MSTLGMSYQDIINSIDEKVNKAIEYFHCGPVSVVYSAYDYDEWDNPIDNLDEIPIKGNVRFISENEEFQSAILKSPTWLEITVIANKMVNQTRDFQNRHLKDVDVFKGNENGYVIAKLIMGN